MQDWTNHLPLGTKVLLLALQIAFSSSFKSAIFNYTSSWSSQSISGARHQKDQFSQNGLQWGEDCSSSYPQMHKLMQVFVIDAIVTAQIEMIQLVNR